MAQKKGVKKLASKHKYVSPAIEKIKVIKSQQSPMMMAPSILPY
jgi:hypothetical protein